MRQILQVAAAALLLTSGAASARDQQYIHKLTNPDQFYQISYNNPYECDSRTIQGAQIWNDTGSNFATFHGSLDGVYFFDGNIVKGRAGTQIAFEPVGNMVNGATAVAEHVPGSTAGTTTVDGWYIYNRTDADIRVNQDKWAAGRFYCDQTATIGNQLYFDRVIAHEMGHVVGLDDRSAGTDCLMYYALAEKAALKPACTAEAGLPIRLYGAYQP
ncbi:MAG TPA: hypothetical protein VF574_00935 [Allosphingosinicella sp.]|jgi:hypothetical protein